MENKKIYNKNNNNFSPTYDSNNYSIAHEEYIPKIIWNPELNKHFPPKFQRIIRTLYLCLLIQEYI